jgi:nitrite reductase/ring-hydroxylating ferredoxin subunit
MSNDDAKPGSCPGSGCSGPTLNRRTFLSISGTSAGLLAVSAAVPSCGNPTGSDPTGPVAAGNLSALSIGTILVMSNIVVARDVNGVYAMSAVCTHQGCLINDSAKTIAGGLQCPCHGSAFDGSGLVIHGPAQRPLQHYAVTIAADGSMTVEGDQPVAADARTPAP